MAGSALITASCKVTGVESLSSLSSMVYDLSSRFTATVPTDVDAAHGVSTVAWAALPATIGGAVSGVLIKATSEDLEVSLGTTVDELDFTIPEGECAFIPTPAGTIKVKWTTAGGVKGEYDFIVFGASS